MLRIAIPNKGGLSEPAIKMLSEAGYRTRRRGRELYITDENNQVEIFFLRPADIAQYVGAGFIQAGITGRDLLADSGVKAQELLPLEFGKSTFRFAAPQDTISTIQDLEGKRIATSFDRIVQDYLAEQQIEATTVHLEGAVESAVRLGVADAIADVVETGNTLRAAGLEVFGEPLMKSEAVLIANPQASNPGLEVLKQRLRGVLNARNYVLLDYNVRRDLLDQAVRYTPGISSPTISSLQDSNWFAVRAMCKRSEVHGVVDNLHALGAEGILVTQLLSARI